MEHEGNWYIFGGYGSRGNTYLDDFLKLDLSTFTFSTIDTTTKWFKIWYYNA